MCASFVKADIISQTAIEELLMAHEGPCLSFFLPIEQRAGHEVGSEPLRLRHLVAEAEKLLALAGLRTPEIGALLAPVGALAQPSKEFWGRQRAGLALFVAPDFWRSYLVDFAMPERVAMGQHFVITPLLQLMTTDETFYLLALSQNVVRFFRGNRTELSPVALPDAPLSLAEALRYDQVERSLQQHSTGSGSRPGRRPAVFHGQGVAGDEALVHANLRRFLQEVDRAVTSYLSMTPAPLILAGVDVELGLYRQITHYAHLLSPGIPGNPDQLSAESLHRAAWALMTEHAQQATQEAIACYEQLAGQGGEHTACGIKEVALAAAYQAVDTLLVTSIEPIWGRLNSAENQVVIHEKSAPGDEDLVNLAIVNTLNNRGKIYQVEPAQMAEVHGLAAILRR